MIAALIGFVLGIAIVKAMDAVGMTRSRDGYSIILVAIALFWPVFAAEAGHWDEFALQAVVFLMFALVAVWARRQGLLLLGAAIASHGVYDLVVHQFDPSGPDWWPAFCGGVDIALGGLLMWRERQVNENI